MAKIYDVCIIGSGAAGGMTGHVLTQAGLNVAMLEAGPKRDPAELPEADHDPQPDPDDA